MIIGVDATNLRIGGGVIHLIELLNVARPEDYGISRVVVWGNVDTLLKLKDRPWLIKKPLHQSRVSIINRLKWQLFDFSLEIKSMKCDLLFVPGGSVFISFKPIVTMCRNMLPFEPVQLLRYGFSLTTFKLFLLRFIQLRSFHRADGLIFLSKYAKSIVEKNLTQVKGEVKIIQHGLNSRFLMSPRPQYKIGSYTSSKPYRLIYVSIVDVYKHQWHLVHAVQILRKETGWNIVLDLVGPAYKPALKLLNVYLNKYDPSRSWVNYHGEVEHDKLNFMYAQANLGVFASSCENMPNILLETMGSGLPIIAANCGPMPEMLGGGAVFFDPESPNSIAIALQKVIESPELRTQLSSLSFYAASKYSWPKCSDETLLFLRKIYDKSR
jgi:glycosyltransferase involved in cell wall biosynthesis